MKVSFFFGLFLMFGTIMSFANVNALLKVMKQSQKFVVQKAVSSIKEKASLLTDGKTFKPIGLQLM